MVLATALLAAPVALGAGDRDDSHHPKSHHPKSHHPKSHRHKRHHGKKHHRSHHRPAAVPKTSSSLYTGAGPRPGPDVLYQAPAVAPQLTNTGIWHAQPILVSGATAYREGEFLYQDWIYDDHGAHYTSDPNYPGMSGDLFSKPDGTYDYPSGPGYNNNAADLVEFRVKPTAGYTAFRITLNTLHGSEADRVLDRHRRHPRDRSIRSRTAPTSARRPTMFLTVHPSGSPARRRPGQRVERLASCRPGHRTVHVDLHRRQIEVDVPHAAWNPGRSTVRLAMGVGLWDAANNRYLLPQQAADATHPGGAGAATSPAAFFNVAFRSNDQEPLPSVTAGTGVLTDPRWWRDEAQGKALATGDISKFYANVNFAKLWGKVTDNSQIPTTGPIDRILPSHFEPAQGARLLVGVRAPGREQPVVLRARVQRPAPALRDLRPHGPGPRGWVRA